VESLIDIAVPYHVSGTFHSRSVDRETWRLTPDPQGLAFRFSLKAPRTNSGPLISSELRKKILHSPFTTKAAGLGLSICRSILAMHGGRLEIDDSYPNTRFLIVLPKVVSETEKIAA